MRAGPTVKARRYLELLNKEKTLRGCIYYELFNKGSSLKDSTYNTVSDAVKYFTLKNKINLHQAIVTIDGLTRSERHKAAFEIRQRGVILKKFIRGTRDESSSLLRLADAVAGLAREKTEQNKTLSKELRSLEKAHLIKL